MQQIAAEIGFAESAFVRSPTGGCAATVLIFTTDAEVRHTCTLDCRDSCCLHGFPGHRPTTSCVCARAELETFPGPFRAQVPQAGHPIIGLSEVVGSGVDGSEFAMMTNKGRAASGGGGDCERRPLHTPQA